MKALFLSLFPLLFLIGCNTVSPNPQFPSATQTPAFGTPIATVSLFGSASPETLFAGETMTVELSLEPVFLQHVTTGYGSFSSRKPDPNPRVREMRVCFRYTITCRPQEAWIPFQTKYSQTFPVDWIGKRRLYYFVELRDADGNLIAGLDEVLNPQNPQPPPLSLESVLDTRTPFASQPAFVQTATQATRVAFPVTGSLVLENGRCCAGGKVNSTINITADFAASSPKATVTEMRVRTYCTPNPNLDSGVWEPFVPQKTFRYTITVPNFVGWYLAVEYRDSQGNVSPVYCDDISIEGSP